MRAESIGPPNAVIQRQLDRMLDSRLFQSRPRQAEVFKVMVEGSMGGTEITEKYLRERVFPTPPYKPDSTIARRSADLVRNLVTNYYDREGLDDPVIIQFPEAERKRAISEFGSPKGGGKRIKLKPGEAYTPIFSYNPRHIAARECRLAEHYRGKGPMLGKNTGKVVLHYVAALKSECSYLPAIVGMAETLCSHLLVHSELPEYAQTLEVAKTYVDHCSDLAPDSWRTHFVRAYYLLCQHDPVGASAEISEAMKIDRAAMMESGKLFEYLFYSEQFGESLKYAEDVATDQVDDPWVQSLYGFTLLMTDRVEEAERTAKFAIELDPNCWAAHVCLMSVYLYAKRLEDAERERMEVLRLSDEDSARFFSNWCEGKSR